MDIFSRPGLILVIVGMVLLPEFVASGGGHGWVREAIPARVVPVEYLNDYLPTRSLSEEKNIVNFYAYFDHRYGKGNWELDDEELLILRSPDTKTRREMAQTRILRWNAVSYSISVSPGFDLTGAEIDIIISEHNKSGNSQFTTHNFVATQISELSSEIRALNFNYQITDGGPYYMHAALIRRDGEHKKVVISRFEDDFKNRWDNNNRLYHGVDDMDSPSVANDNKKRPKKKMGKLRDVLDRFRAMIFVTPETELNYIGVKFFTGWKNLYPYRLPKKSYKNIYGKSLVKVVVKKDGATLVKINPGILTSRFSLGGFQKLKSGQVIDVEIYNGTGKQAVFRTTFGSPLVEGSLMSVRVK
jgi:hypothetical protein